MNFNRKILLLLIAYGAGMAVMSAGCGEVESTSTESTEPSVISAPIDNDSADDEMPEVVNLDLGKTEDDEAKGNR